MKQILSHQPAKDDKNWKQKLQVFKIKKKSFIYNKDIILPNLTRISKLGWLKMSARRALVILC